MEISDYVRILGRRFWLLLLVPLLAGGAAFAITAQQPKTYQTRVTVNLPGLTNALPSQVAQAVADFQAAVAAPPVQTQVAKETGLSVAKLQSEVTTGQVANSQLVTVTHTSSRRNADQAQNVVISSAKDALTFMYKTRTSAAQSKVDTANQTVADKKKALDTNKQTVYDFVAKNQYIDPTQEFAAQRTQVNALQMACIDAQAKKAVALPGQPPAGGDPEPICAQYNTVLKAMIDTGKQLFDYNKLQQDVTDAKAELDLAEQEARDAQRALADTNPTPEITLGKVISPADRTSSLIKATAVAAIAAAPLGFLLVVLLEVSSRRRAARRRPSSPPPASAPPAKTPTTVG